MKRSAAFSTLLFLGLLSGCATSITYPNTHSFEINGDVSEQVNKAREMITDYDAKGDELAKQNDQTALTNIFWGTTMVTAAVYKAPKDVLSGLAIGAGTSTITNGTFNVPGQLGIYQSASSALICIRDAGERLERLRKTAGVDSREGVTSEKFTAHARLVTHNPCREFEDNERQVLHQDPPPSPMDIRLASQKTMACTAEVPRLFQAMNSLSALANEAAAILPGRQMADQLQGLDRSVRQKLRALLTVRSANDFKVDLSKLLAAGEAEQKAKFAKEDALSGTRSLQHILRMPTNANLNNVNAQADYAAAVIGFDGALTACRAGAGI